MLPRFWKLSHGTDQFSHEEILHFMDVRLVLVHQNTPPKGGSKRSQGDDFAEAPIGDYFYLTHGNQGILLLGQFTGPANVFSEKQEGWLDRPYRVIAVSTSPRPYEGPKKWWTPNDNSTFVAVPPDELMQFEAAILGPYFRIKLVDSGVDT